MQYDDGASQSGKSKIAKKPARQPASMVGSQAGAKGVRLVFFGNERLATGLTNTSTPTLNSLIEHGYEIAAVVSNYTEGRSRNARKLEIAEIAGRHKIPIFLPTHIRDIKDDIKNLNADLGVLVAYGKIVPQEIIDIFPNGIINIHPSLLPKYRGPTPIEQTILDGATETGTSIMQLVSEMDAGPVYTQSKISTSGTESKEELAEKLLQLGGEILLRDLPSILDGSKKPTPQNNSEATYTNIITKEDGLVNWNKPAEQIEREVRAYLGWPKTKATMYSKEIVITKARIAKSIDDGELVVECQPGWLEIQELTAPSGRSITGAEFLRGYSKS